MQHHSTHLTYRPDIDGLRALAILLVVVFHAFPGVLPGGFVGVDVFFVISGFLISGIVAGNLDRGTFSFAEFYRRRIRRIFPALILVLAACLGAGWFVLLPDEYTQLGKHVLGGAGFSSNLVLLGESGYFDNDSNTKPLLHLWSLGVEEQFYILWPVLLWAASRKNLNRVHLALVIGFASFAYNMLTVFADQPTAFYAPHSRMWELLAGAALAFLPRRGDALPSARWRGYGAWAGMGLIVTAALVLSPAAYFPGLWALLPTLGAVLIILGGGASQFNGRVLASTPMVALGKISYPLYLWHWPLLVFAGLMANGAASAGIRGAAVMLALALAGLTYRFIERPVRTVRLAAAPLASSVLLAAVALAGAVSWHEDGFPRRPSLELSMAKYDSETNWRVHYQSNPACRLAHAELARANNCLAGDTEPTVLIVGDSHANSLYPGMRDALAGAADTVMNLAAWACPPFFDTELAPGRQRTEDACAKRMTPILDYALRTPSIRTIVVAARGPLYVNGTGYGNGEGEARTKTHLALVSRPEITDPVEVYRLAMRETLRRLADSGKRIVFVLDTPELGFDPTSCLHLRPVSFVRSAIREPCAVPRRDFDDRNRAYREIVFSVLKEFPSVSVFDAAGPLCDDNWCWAMRDGELLYRDDDHLSVAGSRYIARELAKDLFSARVAPARMDGPPGGTAGARAILRLESAR